MSLVLDSSMTLAWLFADESTEAAERAFGLVVETGLGPGHLAARSSQ